MPIYEFYSPETHKIYQFFSRKLHDTNLLPRCPDGGSTSMEKVVSTFALIGRATESQPSGEAELAPGDEMRLRELARQMGSLDHDHPNPRQLGRLMRQFAETTGEKLPEQFGEMIRRLESGDDPEKLQAEFGDSWDEDLPAVHASDEKGETGRKAKTLLRRLRPPERDPILYELSDYL